MPYSNMKLYGSDGKINMIRAPVLSTVDPVTFRGIPFKCNHKHTTGQDKCYTPYNTTQTLEKCI